MMSGKGSVLLFADCCLRLVGVELMFIAMSSD